MNRNECDQCQKWSAWENLKQKLLKIHLVMQNFGEMSWFLKYVFQLRLWCKQTFLTSNFDGNNLISEQRFSTLTLMGTSWILKTFFILDFDENWLIFLLQVCWEHPDFCDSLRTSEFVANDVISKKMFFISDFDQKIKVIRLHINCHSSTHPLSFIHKSNIIHQHIKYHSFTS